MTFVDRLTLDICGEVAQHGVCLADVTGDGDSELVVATDIGDLYIYKYGEQGLLSVLPCFVRSWKMGAEKHSTLPVCFGF